MCHANQFVISKHSATYICRVANGFVDERTIVQRLSVNTFSCVRNMVDVRGVLDLIDHGELGTSTESELCSLLSERLHELLLGGFLSTREFDVAQHELLLAEGKHVTQAA